MDQTTLSTLLTVGGMLAGFLIRHYLGAPMPSTPANASPVSAPAAPPSLPAVASVSPAQHPLLAALTAQFDAAIQQVALNFANSALAAPTANANSLAAPSK